MADDERVQAVGEVLAAVGGHRLVPFEVVDVRSDGVRFHVELVLHYLRDTLVCCGDPRCYAPFLGMKRVDVPVMLACKLGLPVPPRVSMTVHQRYDAGYQHVDLRTGRPSAPGADCTTELDEDHFRPPPEGQ